MYPPRRPGMAAQGADVYRANGCVYCHSQQVRPRGFGADIERGWGGRPSLVQSVAQDYLYDQPVMLGSQRVGPDLANIGKRQPDAATLFKHLYEPRLVTPGSVMPPYRYLFHKVPLQPGEKPSPDALALGATADYQVLPTDEARQLVAYLLSLHSDSLVFATPPFPPRTNAPPGGTNAPAASAGTNAPSAGTNTSGGAK